MKLYKLEYKIKCNKAFSIAFLSEISYIKVVKSAFSVFCFRLLDWETLFKTLLTATFDMLDLYEFFVYILLKISLGTQLNCIMIDVMRGDILHN